MCICNSWRKKIESVLLHFVIHWKIKLPLRLKTILAKTKNILYFGTNDAQTVSPAQQLDASMEDLLADDQRKISGAFTLLVQLITVFQLQETAPRCLHSLVMFTCDSESYSQLSWSSCRRSLCSFSYLLLRLALLLASVIRTLPHGQPPLRIRGRFGVIVFRQFA